MKFVALISGGKDSLVSALDAIRHGHELICLANIAPEVECCSSHGGDVDSHTFQTVGHEAVPLIAYCMGLPLLRKRINRGQSRVTTLDYSHLPPAASDGVADEVEVLAELLLLVKQQFPDVQGVSSGAIQSNYQRLRVEAVCRRLQLQSLAFLWQRPAEDIFAMCQAFHVHAVFAKVSSIGLTPAQWLGQAFLSREEQLLALRAKYGVHPAGEGGEFETIVLDSPLFASHKLVISSSSVVAEVDTPYNAVGYLEAVYSTVEKTPEERVADARILHSLRGMVFSSDTMSSLMRLKHEGEAIVSLGNGCVLQCMTIAGRPTVRQPLSAPRGQWTNVRCEDLGQPSRAFTSVCEQARFMFAAVMELTSRHKRSTFMMLIYCPAMALYAEINRAFTALVGNVPARAFLEVNELGSDMMLDFFFCEAAPVSDVAAAEPAATSGVMTVRWESTLRVESISCWAAATIGPYAQAVELTSTTAGTTLDATTCRREVVVSGRIGMVPASLGLANSTTDTALLETVRCRLDRAGVGSLLQLPNALDLVAQFCFMYGNSVSAVEHYGLTSESISHVTFFLQNEVFAPLLPILWELCSGGSSKVVPWGLQEEEESVEKGSCRGRLWLVSQMPKGALVEMYCVATAC
jgi:diphthine-ammonia ligase